MWYDFCNLCLINHTLLYLDLYRHIHVFGIHVFGIHDLAIM